MLTIDKSNNITLTRGGTLLDYAVYNYDVEITHL